MDVSMFGLQIMSEQGRVSPLTSIRGAFGGMKTFARARVRCGRSRQD